jgi:probable rRNA maturation factor
MIKLRSEPRSADATVNERACGVEFFRREQLMGTSRRRRSPLQPDQSRFVVEVLLRSSPWKAHPTVKPVLRKALVEAASLLAVRTGEVSVVLTSDAAIRALNAKWRRRDRATDVLSFPVEPTHSGDGISRLLGDIVIAYETTRCEAVRQKKPFLNHLAHLAVHGFLHLLGYDHERQRDAKEMQRLETSILARLEIPDPYAEPAASSP